VSGDHGLPFGSGSFDIGADIVAARHRERSTAFLSAIGGVETPLPLAVAATMTGQGALHVNATILPVPSAVLTLATNNAVAITATREECPQSTGGPPRLAEFCLALFMSGAKGEALLGCLSERFERDCKRFGVARARRIYWAQAIQKSLWPLLKRAFARLITCRSIGNCLTGEQGKVLR
jgi:hypothetical protein